MIYTTVNEKMIKSIYKRRDGWVHKGNFGRVLVIGGSDVYTGSPAIVALSALRSGCDLTEIIAPKRTADVCASFSPELITIAVDGRTLNADSISIIKNAAEKSDVIVIGNGLGIGEGQKMLVNHLVREINKKIVIDADAIKMVDKKLLDKRILITPNSNEFKILFGEDPSKDTEKRIKQVYEKASEFRTNILLKGHVDVISNGEKTFINKINSVYMTKGGTGDSLTGICASLIAQGNEIIESAATAAFINGYSGRTVGKKERESFSVMHLVESIGSTINKWRYQ